MSSKKQLKLAEEKIGEMGAKVLSIEQHRNHFKLRVEYKDQTRMFVKAVTPSDNRAEMNFLGDVKRWMRNL